MIWWSSRTLTKLKLQSKKCFNKKWKIGSPWLKATTTGKAWYFCERIAANWYNNKHVKLFLFLFEFYNSRSPNGLWVKKFFMKTGDNDSGFFPHYQSLIIVTTIDLSIVNNASQTGKRVTVFHWPAKVCYPCMAWTNFINRPKTSRPWLYLTKHHKMLKRKLSFQIRVPSPND